MRWPVFALLLLFGGDSVPTPDPARDQKTVSFEARRIESWPTKPLSLPEAIEVITEQTGNKIIILDTSRHPEVVAAKNTVDYTGKTFWEAVSDLARTWDMRLNLNGRDSMLLNYGVDMREAAKDGRGFYDNLSNPSTISPVQYQGPYAITFEGGDGVIKARVFAEPRLENFQCDQAELRVRGVKGKSRKLRLKEVSKSRITFEFDRSSFPDEIQSVAFQCRLIYAHDWKIEKLGRLDKVLKSRKKKHKVGLHTFRVVSSKYATASPKHGINKGTEFGLVIGYHFASKIHYSAADFVLVRTGKDTMIEEDPFDIDKYWQREPSVEFHYPMATRIPPGELELWVRAPHRISKTKIKHTRDLRE